MKKNETVRKGTGEDAQYEIDIQHFILGKDEVNPCLPCSEVRTSI
jgi:hypothetical protein